MPPRVSHRSRSPTSRFRSGDGQSMWPPKMEARVLQELHAEAGRARARDRHRQRLLHGAARARACGRDHACRDRSAPCRRSAREARARTASATSRLEVGDGARGWGASAYDVIVLTGSTPLLPERVRRAVEARRPAVRRRRRGAGDAGTARALGPRPARACRRTLFETVVPPLMNARDARAVRVLIPRARSRRSSPRWRRTRRALAPLLRRRARALGIRLLPHRGLAARPDGRACRRRIAESAARSATSCVVCHHGVRSYQAARVARRRRVRPRAQPRGRRRRPGRAWVDPAMNALLNHPSPAHRHQFEPDR